jgi:DHA3 family macrolide efflux protein-like MFS transporter
MTDLFVSLRSLGRPFWRLWLGVSISGLGAQLMQFALGVWVYQRTGSVLDFAGVIVAGLVPQLLVLPIAGNLVDRLNRRLVIIVSDCAVALMSVAVILLLWWGALQVIHLYAFTLIAALASAFKDPAYRASIGTMLRDDQLTRASGLFGVSTTALGIVAPTLAGGLIVMVGLTGLAILDLVTFSVGSALIWRAFVYYSAPPVAHSGIHTVLGESLDNFRRSLSFFVQSAAMRGMFFYSLMQTALLGLAATLAIPLILANHPPQSLGVALSCAAAGALFGSMLMALLESPRRRGVIILVCDAVLACCVAGAGLADSVLAYSLLEAVGCCAGSVGASCAFALWISNAPEAQRGSILVVQATAARLCTAVIVLFGATLADTWLEAALTPGRILASIGELLLNVPNGRGIAMLFVISGALGLAAVLGGYACKPLRNLQ